MGLLPTFFGQRARSRTSKVEESDRQVQIGRVTLKVLTSQVFEKLLQDASAAAGLPLCPQLLFPIYFK